MTTNARLVEREHLPAGAILPGDAGYDDARISFNGMLDRCPAAIVSPASTAEVGEAVRAARAAGLAVAIRGGGHSVAGHCIADEALVISLDRMRASDVDPTRRLLRAGGGALWNDVDAAAFEHGLAVPGGTFGDTGIGGLTLGGGIGYLMPIAGLTCDNLVGAEVVTADGSVVEAGPGGDPELLWALRGGGGNFGIVTRFDYRLTPIGPMWGGSIRFAAGLARPVLERVETMMAAHPTATMPTFGIHRDPDHGDAVLVSLLLGIVDGSDPETVVAPLRDLPAVEDGLGPMTYLDLQAMSGIMPFGLRQYWKGHFLRDLDGDLFERVVGLVADDDAIGESFVLIEGIVGAGRDEPPEGAAFGQRAARWNASALAIWASEEDDERGVGWARRVVDALAPASLNGAGYANYSPADETDERVRAIYGTERWRRLVAVKRRYDPDNVFRFNLNIRPD